MPNPPTVTPFPSPPSTDDDAVAEARNPPAPAPNARQRQELQTPFLTGLLNRTVTVYLVNGVRLSGTLKRFDAFTVLLHDARDSGSLIFKHAISTIIPGAPAAPTPRRTPFGKLAEWKR